MIGDRVTDLIPADKLGFKTVLVETGYGLKNIEKLKENNLKSEIYTNILDFAKKLRNKQKWYIKKIYSWFQRYFIFNNIILKNIN